jgi:hypothetical protein
MKRLFYLHLAVGILCGSTSIAPCSAADFIAPHNNLSSVQVRISSEIPNERHVTEYTFGLNKGETHKVDLEGLLESLQTSHTKSKLIISAYARPSDFRSQGIFTSLCYSGYITKSTNIDTMNHKLYNVSLEQGPSGPTVKCQAQ